MRTDPLTRVLAVVALWAFSSSAFAVSIAANPDNVTINVGETIKIVIIGDWTDDPTAFGGLDIDWDPAVLALQSWQPIDWGNDPDFFDPGLVDAAGGSISSFAAGNFGGVAGPEVMGSITFEAIGEGLGNVVLSDDLDGPAGPFLSSVTFLPQVVDFVSPTIQVNAVIPLPAAAWLMLGGLGALVGVRRKARDNC